MLKSNTLGYSVYVSTWPILKSKLSSLYSEGSFIFTSLHIEEEIKQPHYVDTVFEMTQALKTMGYRIIADVSPRTLNALNVPDFKTLVETYHLDVLRCDFGFTFDDLIEIGSYCDLCVNASMSEDGLVDLKSKISHQLTAMHNFYPRPETGLDLDQLKLKNKVFQDHAISLYAFIPSDIDPRRGPLYSGLPTCEVHRTTSPLVGIIDCLENGIDHVIVGDGVLSDHQVEVCQCYLQNRVITLPCEINDLEQLKNHSVMTIRSDSPKDVLRLLESRLYATSGQSISPHNTIHRSRGSITLDNELYLRYSGEVQILKKEFNADERVNVIGKVKDLQLLDRCQPGMKLRLMKEKQ